MEAVPVVGYIRVSREDLNVENQEYAITKFAASRGLKLIDVYKDVDVSGATPPAQRPGWRSVLRDLELNVAKGVIVYALDRIARSLWELFNIYREFNSRGWTIYSIREDWLNNVDHRVKDLIIAILGWAGEMEREFVRERTRAALARARAQGKRVGRPPKWTAETRAKIIDLVRRGLTLREAAELTGVSYSLASKRLARDKEYLEALITARTLGLRKKQK